MDVVTSWLRPPQSIGGLDHLGTQAPCILIYSQLLDGITNVTDRARYFSFYPWLVWSFEQQFPKADAQTFVEYYRRADCLYSLIAERHARRTDGPQERHGAAMVGRQQLVPALSHLEAGHQLHLSNYTAQDSEHRYFKNELGGLGQYYAGVLDALGLMDPSQKPWIRFTLERGKPLAEALDRHVDSKKFWSVVESNEVTVSALDKLRDFCPCRLAESLDERQVLAEILFDRKHVYGRMGLQRQQSLALMLHLSQSLSELGQDLTDRSFRKAVYSGLLPGAGEWNVPAKLIPTRKAWALYERNDIFSVAMQVVFRVCLDAVLPLPDRPNVDRTSIEAFVRSLSQSDIFRTASQNIGARTFNALRQRVIAQNAAPGDPDDPEHEIAILRESVAASFDFAQSASALSGAIQVLARLAIRDDTSTPAYEAAPITTEDLANYPINLVTLRERVAGWSDVAIEEVISDLCLWTMHTHLRVAMRKLRQTGQSSFRFKPTDRGLQVMEGIPDPTETAPRVRQAVQILRDLGALTREDEDTANPTRPSDLGIALLEEAIG